MGGAPRILFDLFLLFAAARLAGALCERVKQPAVVGEIAVGLLLGPHVLCLVQATPALDPFAQLGVVFLLFVAGLETEPTALWRVGRKAVVVAPLGIALSFGLGLLLMRAVHQPLAPSLFVATALAATSVGIAARVLTDLRQLGTPVANVILGAAVLDDVLGMIVLAVVSGAAAGSFASGPLAVLLAETLAFIGLAVFLAPRAVRGLAPHLARLSPNPARNPVFGLAIALCLAFSALTEVMGLAAIIGAFFAGIVFSETREAPGLRRAIHPIYEFLVPIFFVLLGVQVDLTAFASHSVLLLAGLVTLVAVVGKVVGCGLGALSLGKRQALAVGVGMIPRGEVGMVAALLGLSHHVIGHDLYSVIIVMCALTSLVAPPLLRAALGPPAAAWDVEAELESGGRP
jgi:Kef-type K+ transport system membrane component KefB